MQAAKTILKPQSLPLTMSAEEMRQDWAPIYARTGDPAARAQTWRDYAAECPELQRPSAQPWIPDAEEWFAKIRKMSGVAGPDGWESN